jgi:hypothetical protein
LARSPLPLLQSPSPAWHFCTNSGESKASVGRLAPAFE